MRRVKRRMYVIAPVGCANRGRLIAWNIIDDVNTTRNNPFLES